MSYKRDFFRNRYRNRMFSHLKMQRNHSIRPRAWHLLFTLYTNTREFLRGEIEENQLVKAFDTSTEYLTDLWKQKYARKRIASLVKNERVNIDDTLFYDDICFMSWDETKDKYLKVGR